MLENLWLIPLTKHPTHPTRPTALTLGRSSYANFPGPGMTIRCVSLHAHKHGCDYSSLASTPEAFADGHLTRSHTVTTGRASLLTPLTSRAHAGRLGCEDLDAGLLDDLGEEKKKHNRTIRLF